SKTLPSGQRSNGPAAVSSWRGARCHLPTARVLYPPSRRMRGSVPALFGIAQEYPGKVIGMSARNPMPTAWWLRPVMRQARVGERAREARFDEAEAPGRERDHSQRGRGDEREEHQPGVGVCADRLQRHEQDEVFEAPPSNRGRQGFRPPATERLANAVALFDE